MRRSFWLLFWFNFSATWNAAILTALFDWKAGWLFAIAMGGAFFLIWKYDPEKLLRQQANNELDDVRRAAFELTDASLNEDGSCKICASRHAALREYPFDYRLHHMYCTIPGMRMRLEQVSLCPDASMFEIDEIPKEQQD